MPNTVKALRALVRLKTTRTTKDRSSIRAECSAWEGTGNYGTQEHSTRIRRRIGHGRFGRRRSRLSWTKARAEAGRNDSASSSASDWWGRSEAPDSDDWVSRPAVASSAGDERRSDSDSSR